MPKPRVQTARRPPCPKGHQGEVWLDGFYARDGKHERPRFRCVPRIEARTGKRPPFHANGDKPHTFIEPLARRHPTTANGAPHFCEECEHALDRHEGPQTTRRQTFTIREAAQAVIQVAKGMSMWRASRDARESADRLAMTTWAGMRPSPHGQLASDQLAMFGTMVRDALIPRPWPDSVALDETSFDVVITDKTATGKVSSPGTASVLGVYGYPAGRGSGRAAALVPRGGGDAVEWLEVLRSRPNEPTWVVCDQGKAVMSAIRTAWPNATIYVCEAHLRMLAEQRLTADGFDRTSALWKALRAAIGDRVRWDQLEADAHAAGATRTLAWMSTNRRLMERQWQIRDPDRPLSIGGLETVLRTIVDRLGDRRLVFRNQARLELVFDLMGLEMAGLMTERRVGDIIRRELLANDGRPRRERRSLDDHGSSSLYDAIRNVNARLAPKRAQNVKAAAARRARLKAAGQSRPGKPRKAVTKRGRSAP